MSVNNIFSSKSDLGSFLIREYNLNEREFTYSNIDSFNNFDFWLHPSLNKITRKDMFLSIEKYFNKSGDLKFSSIGAHYMSSTSCVFVEILTEKVTHSVYKLKVRDLSFKLN